MIMTTGVGPDRIIGSINRSSESYKSSLSLQLPSELVLSLEPFPSTSIGICSHSRTALQVQSSKRPNMYRALFFVALLSMAIG